MRRHRPIAFCCLAAVVLYFGCERRAESPNVRPTAQELFDVTLATKPLPPCQGTVVQSASPRRELHVVVHRDRSVSPSVVMETTAGAALEARHLMGLELRPVADTVLLDVDPALRATPAEVEAAVEGVGATAKDELGQSEAARVIYRPFREFVESLESTDERRIHLVFLPEIATKGSLARGVLGELPGLTLTPEGVETALGPWFPHTRFEPVVFVGVESLLRRSPGSRGTTIAHEFGHALGLEHRDEPHDLMFAGDWTCRPKVPVGDRKHVAESPLARPTGR